MTENVMTLIFGALIGILGIINMTGNVSSLHSYHRHRVSEADRKPFARRVGIGTLIIGISLVAKSIFYMLYASTGLARYEFIGLTTLIVCMLIGLAITFFAMIKYNKGIF